MSEKRFTLDEEDRLCIHYNGRIVACVGCRETEAEKIVGLLNEQQATITAQKKGLDEYMDNIIALSKENEQLRQILKDIVGATDETYTKNTSMFKVTVVLDYEKYREIRRCIE